MLRKLGLLLVSLWLALGVSVVWAPPAQAVWDCDSWREWPNWGYARCNYGTGGVRLVLDCWYPQDNSITRWYGQWKPAGQTSIVICNGGSYAVYDSYQTF